eukprot:15348412-Ditylum_brightwellii.AAC.2
MLPPVFVILLEEVNASARDAVTNNINNRLTSLEEYVGTDFEATVGDEYPTASVTIKEMIACLQ